MNCISNCLFLGLSINLNDINFHVSFCESLGYFFGNFQSVTSQFNHKILYVSYLAGTVVSYLF